MPRKTYKPKFNRRRRQKRARTTKKKLVQSDGCLRTTHGSKLTVKKMMNVFPDVALVKLPYTDTRTFTSTTGVVNRYSFLNSLYDPDKSSGGGQPLGRDQWASLYEKYNVVGMAYDFTCVGDDTKPIMVAVQADEDSGGTVSNMDQLIQQPNSSKRITILPGKKARLKGYIDCAKIRGIPKSNYNTDLGYQIAMGGDPSGSQTVYCNLFFSALDEASTASMTFTARITYYARLSEKIVLAES